MKITFYPAKEAVLARLAHSLKEVQGSIDECEKAIKEKEEPSGAVLIHNPYTQTDIRHLKSELAMHRRTEASIQDTIGLVESGSETIQAETEV